MQCSLEHKAAKHRALAHETEIKEEEELDRSLRDEDHAAICAYKEQQRKLRKKSLSYRLQKARRDHEYNEAVKQFEKMQLQEDLELRREDWKAVQLHQTMEKRAQREANRAFAAKAKLAQSPRKPDTNWTSHHQVF